MRSISFVREESGSGFCQPRALPAVALVLLSVLACTPTGRSAESAEVKRSAIIGGDSIEATASQDLPARGVGWITNKANGNVLSGRGCSASPILRDVVLTAGHCLCLDKNAGVDDKTVVFHLNHINSTGALVDVGPLVNGVAQGIPAKRVEVDTLFCDPFQSVIEPANYVPKDLAIVVLSQPLSVDELPELNEVYTLPDFTDRAFNRPEDEGFYQEPLRIVGWDGSVPSSSPPVKKIATATDVSFDRGKVFQFGPFCIGGWLCSNDAPGIWLHDPIDVLTPANRLEIEHGDSGGPITFLQNGVKPTIFGVASIGSPGLAGIFGPFNSWSPTWDNKGLKGGTFIASFLQDADGDGVSDVNDNCSPPRCDSHATCFNPNQDDLDGDGIGDACDICPPDMCARMGVDPSLCSDPAQRDSDADGVGDVCDLCPTKKTSRYEADKNHDGVGDSCDNCPSAPFGGRLACHSNSDCPRGICLTTDFAGGRCGDGSNRACQTFTGFPGCTPCLQVGQWGVCSESFELDTDGDTIGNRCDLCPLYSDAKLQHNSNTHAEAREGASPRNDACESIPLFTSRTIVEPYKPNARPPSRTLFSAFAGVGSDNSAPHAPYPGAPVGFRHCDCDPDLTEASCMQSCGNGRDEFDRAESPWVAVTIGVTPPTIYDPAQASAPQLDRRLTDLIYTGGIDCSDPLPHQTFVNALEPNAYTGLCRVGTGTGRLLVWSTDVDLDAGRVSYTIGPPRPVSGEPQLDIAVRQTYGMFWSHGIVSIPFDSAGDRDGAFIGQLRDNYVPVATPSVSFDLRDVPRVVPATPTNCAFNPECWEVISTDWLKPFIRPGFGINVLRTLPRPFIVYPNCDATGALCGIRRSVDPHIDLELALTSQARFLLGNSSRFLVTPVEPLASDPSLAAGVVAVSVPRSWQQLYSDIEGIGIGSGGQLDAIQVFQTATDSVPENVTPFGGEGYVPSDREGARWLYSKAEQALYMIGGAKGGAPTSEIWRLDLAGAAWKHLFKEDVNPQVGVGNIDAAAYDSSAGKLVVIDEWPGSTRPSARVIAFDTASDRSTVAAVLDLSSFTKVGLTATGGGTYVLVGAKQTGWTAYRFQISAQNKITWLGKKSGQGLVVADPLPWQEGPGLFFQNGSDFDTVDLPPAAFAPSGTPPELGVCDTPLVVPAPAPLVISSCHSPSLQPPTPTHACGSVSVDLKGAPIDFPLGTSTITWVLTDALGNSVTVPQTVTAVLGDDPSCCPAGTNVIMGTSNNDTITGTAGRDCILALGAQDTVNGGGGDDFISGGEGDDVLNGGLGNDRIYGGGGQDVISGNDGNDTLFGGAGDDQCFGGAGNDVLSGGDGQDKLFGEDGADQLLGENGDDRLSGGNGNDVLDGGPGHNACSGGSGTNQSVRCESFF
jgi:Ca2+-binding RTX toxin-like protein